VCLLSIHSGERSQTWCASSFELWRFWPSRVCWSSWVWAFIGMVITGPYKTGIANPSRRSGQIRPSLRPSWTQQRDGTMPISRVSCLWQSGRMDWAKLLRGRSYAGISYQHVSGLTPTYASWSTTASNLTWAGRY